MFESGDYPLISIVTPVYNGSQYIEQLIQSVLEQDYPRIEHLIIDDGSNDHGATVAILQRYPHLRWWTRPNKGQYATLNEGLLAAGGEIFTTISADDWYAGPTAVGSIMDLWRQRRQYDGICGRYIVADAQGHPLSRPTAPWRWPRSLIYYYNYLPHLALLVDRRLLLERQIRFDESLRYSGDRDWAIQLHRSNFRICFVRPPVAYYRFHPAQLTFSGGDRARQEWKRLLRRYNRSYLVCRMAQSASRCHYLFSKLCYCLRRGTLPKRSRKR